MKDPVLSDLARYQAEVDHSEVRDEKLKTLADNEMQILLGTAGGLDEVLEELLGKRTYLKNGFLDLLAELHFRKNADLCDFELKVKEYLRVVAKEMSVKFAEKRIDEKEPDIFIGDEI